MTARARELVADGPLRVGGAGLVLGVAAGPHQQVLRPAELESPDLAHALQREAMFGEHAILDAAGATEVLIRGDVLMLQQQGSSLLLDASGALRIVQPARTEDSTALASIASLIEEEIAESLQRAVRFAGWVLDHVDPLRRLTDVVPAVRLVGADYLPWRTRAEQQASPSSASMGSGGDGAPVVLTPARRHRPALVHDTERIVTDLVTLLRRGRR